MNITLLVSFLSGLAFFLFGMTMMGDALKKIAGNKMQMILGRLASNRFKGIALGTVTTAIIQSSSATSVMVVSFVSSGIMTLTQAISVVMGANIGTTATGWLLTLAGMDAGGTLGGIFSTTFIFGIVAVIGIILYMSGKSPARKNTGVILVSLAVLMTGMKTMSGAMEPLQSSEAFMSMLTVANPVLCVVAGIVATAIIQSCSASIGILQAMSMTGIIPYSVAIPMVVGMSIGACVPVLLSAITANKDGKRTALSYLYFNVLGGAAFFILYAIVAATPRGALFFAGTVDSMAIAIVNTLFKVFSVVVLFAFVPQLEKLVRWSVKDAPVPEKALLDEMLLDYPAQAIERSGAIVTHMAHAAVDNMNRAMGLMVAFDESGYNLVLQQEDEQDEYEDKLSRFLVKLNARELTFQETRQSAKYLRCMTDLERISDHAENVAQLAKGLSDKGMRFSQRAQAELSVCAEALAEIMTIMLDALLNDSMDAAYHIEPLEEVIDSLTERLKQNHIDRLQKGDCVIKAGFMFNDYIHNLERVADHCSNIAVSVIELHDEAASEFHNYLRTLKQGDSELFLQYLSEFGEKYFVRLKDTEPVVA